MRKNFFQNVEFDHGFKRKIKKKKKSLCGAGVMVMGARQRAYY